MNTHSKRRHDCSKARSTRSQAWNDGNNLVDTTHTVAASSSSADSLLKFPPCPSCAPGKCGGGVHIYTQGRGRYVVQNKRVMHVPADQVHRECTLPTSANVILVVDNPTNSVELVAHGSFQKNAAARVPSDGNLTRNQKGASWHELCWQPLSHQCLPELR